MVKKEIEDAMVKKEYKGTLEEMVVTARTVV